MSHADYLRGQADADLHNRIFRSGAYAGEASEILHHEKMEKVCKEKNAEIVGQVAISTSLKKALIKVDPDNPLVNPIRTKDNPVLQAIRDEAKKYYKKTGRDVDDPEYDAIAAAQGYPAAPEPTSSDGSVDSKQLAEYAEESAKKVEEAMKGKKGFFKRLVSGG